MVSDGRPLLRTRYATLSRESSSPSLSHPSPSSPTPPPCTRQVRFTYDASPFMPAVLGGGSRLQFEISKNGGETWDAAGQVTSISNFKPFVTRHTFHDSL